MRTRAGLRLTWCLAVALPVGAPLLVRPEAAAASSINCFLDQSRGDRSASPFVASFCALSESEASDSGGGAGGANGNSPGRSHAGRQASDASGMFVSGAGAQGRAPAGLRSAALSYAAGIGPGGPTAAAGAGTLDARAAAPVSSDSAPDGSIATDNTAALGDGLVDEAWHRLTSDPATVVPTEIPMGVGPLPAAGSTAVGGGIDSILGNGWSDPGLASADEALPGPTGSQSAADELSAVTVPEPGTLTLLAVGAIGLLAAGRRLRTGQR